MKRKTPNRVTMTNRVRPENKSHVRAMAKKHGVSQGRFLDAIIGSHMIQQISKGLPAGKVVES